MLTITADGAPVPGYNQREIKWNDVPIPVSVNISGADEGIIEVMSGGYDVAKRGIGDIHVK